MTYTKEQIVDRQTRLLAALAEVAGGKGFTDGEIMGAAHTLARMDLDQFQAAWDRRKSDLPDHLPFIEGRIIGKLLDTILADPKLKIEVWDEVELAVEATRDRAAIEKETGATGSTYYHVFRGKTRLGFIWLVHGNVEDVISDLTDTPEMHALIAPAMQVAYSIGEAP